LHQFCEKPLRIIFKHQYLPHMPVQYGELTAY